MFKRKDKKYQELTDRVVGLEKEIESLRAEFMEYRQSMIKKEFDRLLKQEQAFKLKQRIRSN